MTILNDVTQGHDLEAMIAEMAKLRAENEALRKAKPAGAMKVTEKGGLSVYGLGRFPLTLYRSQWEKLFSQREAIEAFITANADKLSVKD